MQVRRLRTNADQRATCEVRVKEADAEQIGAFEVGLPQYRLQQQTQIQKKHPKTLNIQTYSEQ
jgi:hypothetical protein